MVRGQISHTISKATLANPYAPNSFNYYFTNVALGIQSSVKCFRKKFHEIPSNALKIKVLIMSLISRKAHDPNSVPGKI